MAWSETQVFNVFACKRTLDRAVHTACGEIFSHFIDAFDMTFDAAMVGAVERMRQGADLRIDRCRLRRRQQTAVLGQRCLRRLQQATSLDLLLAQSARVNIVLGVVKGIAQHTGDVFVRKAVRGFYRD